MNILSLAGFLNIAGEQEKAMDVLSRTLAMYRIYKYELWQGIVWSTYDIFYPYSPDEILEL